MEHSPLEITVKLWEYEGALKQWDSRETWETAPMYPGNFLPLFLQSKAGTKE